jgi:hypothetical protein
MLGMWIVIFIGISLVFSDEPKPVRGVLLILIGALTDVVVH